MKKILIALACLAMAASSYAQGFVLFNTQVSTVAQKIYDTDGVTPLSGTGYLAQLYAADGTVTTDSSLVAKGVPVNFRGGVNAGYVVTTSGKNSLGQDFTSSVAVSDTGKTVTLQVRAWAGGSIASYEAAVAANAAVGKSSLFQVTSVAVPGTPANLTGLTSFKLVGVPEPTTIALGAMGLAALLFRRRK